MPNPLLPNINEQDFIDATSQKNHHPPVLMVKFISLWEKGYIPTTDLDEYEVKEIEDLISDWKRWSNNVQLAIIGEPMDKDE